MNWQGWLDSLEERVTLALSRASRATFIVGGAIGAIEVSNLTASFAGVTFPNAAPVRASGSSLNVIYTQGATLFNGIGTPERLVVQLRQNGSLIGGSVMLGGGLATNTKGVHDLTSALGLTGITIIAGDVITLDGGYTAGTAAANPTLSFTLSWSSS